MTRIENEIQYKAAMQRIEELLPLVDDTTPKDDRNMIELTLFSNLVADYEDEHYPIGQPSLIDILKLRMYEMELTQAQMAELLGISSSRMSEYLNGKAEPTLPIARLMSERLDILPSIVLGVVPKRPKRRKYHTEVA